jgi:amino acid transporter
VSPADAGDPVLLRGTGHPPTTRPTQSRPGPPIGQLAFLGVTVASLGGPLALAALYAPGLIDDTTSSAGFVAIAGAVVFLLPLGVWLAFSRQIQSNGGLYGFVEAAAGRRVALVQAGLWIASYALYLVYTTVAIVYDTLPTVLPGVRPYRTLLEIAIPVVIAAVMLAGRTVTLAVLGVLALGQMALVGALAGVGIAHGAELSAFAPHSPVGDLATPTAQISLLYVCGSLPLFLGGEVVRPARTVRRGLVVGYTLVAAGVVAAVYPLAANPAFTRAPIPGMSLAQVFAGHDLAVAIGLGVAASTAGVMLVEYLALSRLVHVLSGFSTRKIILGLGGVLVAAAPISLIDPERFYDDLLKPSLIALWLSQLMVFAVYPRFAARHGGLRTGHVLLAAGAVAFAIYGIYATLQHAST